MKIRIIVCFATLWIALGTQALAIDAPANLDAYCKQVFGENALPNVDRRDGGILCSIPTNNGLGMTHNKVTLAEVCIAQFGTATYEHEESSVICTNILDRQTGNLAEVNLKDFCFGKHGDSAFVTRNNATGQPMCSVRGDGGLSLTHHVIDPAALCPNGLFPGTVVGEMLTCTATEIASLQQENNEDEKSDDGSEAGKETGEEIGGDSGNSSSGLEPSSGGGASAGSTKPQAPAQPPIQEVTSKWLPSDGELLDLFLGDIDYLVEVRIEQEGNRIRGILERNKLYDGTKYRFYIPTDDREFQKLSEIGQQHTIFNASSALGLIRPGRVLFDVEIGENRKIDGRGLVFVTGSLVLSELGGCMPNYVEQVESDPSLWPDISGMLGNGEIVLNVSLSNITATYEPSGDTSISVDCRSIHNRGMVAKLKSPINVESLELVNAEAPYEPVERLSYGDTVRVLANVDRDSEGRQIDVTLSSAGESQNILAECGGDIARSPRVCVSDVIEIVPEF